MLGQPKFLMGMGQEPPQGTYSVNGRSLVWFGERNLG
jgi:hypothetical protein